MKNYIYDAGVYERGISDAYKESGAIDLFIDKYSQECSYNEIPFMAAFFKR